MLSTVFLGRPNAESGGQNMFHQLTVLENVVNKNKMEERFVTLDPKV